MGIEEEKEGDHLWRAGWVEDTKDVLLGGIGRREIESTKKVKNPINQ